MLISHFHPIQLPIHSVHDCWPIDSSFAAAVGVASPGLEAVIEEDVYKKNHNINLLLLTLILTVW